MSSDAPAPIVPGQWQDGICSCFSDFAICAQTTCCHICTASSLYYREEFKFPTSCDCGSCCLLWCCSGCTAPALMWLPVHGGLVSLMNTSLRRTLIARFGIQGETVCTSCLLGSCCNACTMCQVQREMKVRNQFVGGLCASAPQTLPAPAPQMNVPMGQPVAGQPQKIPGQPVQNFNDWRSGICGCVGAADCCEAYFCGCCVNGHMAGGLNALNGAGGTMGQNDCAVCCCSCVTGGCPCCLSSYNFMMRREIVERYAISTETICKSACLVCFCGPCTLAQARREMGYHGEFPGGLCMKEMPADAVIAPMPAQQQEMQPVAAYPPPQQQQPQQCDHKHAGGYPPQQEQHVAKTV